MSKANLGWLYYKEMYRNGDDDRHIAQTFTKLLQVSTKDESFEKVTSFKLVTTYPGLIIGSGYTHGISSDEDSKMGFYFDFTSGIPTLPGSSVKGVLRSLFGCDRNEAYPQEKQEMIRTLLDDCTLDVEALMYEIFEGVDAKTKEVMGIYRRDIFYEARIMGAAGAILQEDYITPHKEALKNPVPLKIIKISGGTTFEFSFELHDGLISAEKKLELFFQLLQFHGMGAKTNVGYGQFEEKALSKFKSELRLNKEALEEARAEAKKEQEKSAQQEKLKDAPQEVQIFEASKGELTTLIKQMQDGMIAEELLTPLAVLVKEALQKNPKEWDKAKQKALKRKEYIQGLLGA